MDFPEVLSKYPKRKEAEWKKASLSEMLEYLEGVRGIPEGLVLVDDCYGYGENTAPLASNKYEHEMNLMLYGVSAIKVETESQQ